MTNQQPAFAELIDKSFVDVRNNAGQEIVFDEGDNGDTYTLMHDQECCESVTVESIDGDLSDLIGSPILFAEESSSDDENGTWTFYRIGTIKGTAIIRWYGHESYYSLSVSMTKTARGHSPVTPRV